MIRFINVICFVLALATFFLFFKQDRITQDVLDLFPTTEDRKIVDIYQEFSHSRFVLVAIKGFSDESSHTLDAFLAKISKLENVAQIQREQKPSKELQDFISQNYYFVATPKVYTESGVDSNVAQILSPTQIATQLQTGIKSLMTTQRTQDSKNLDSLQSAIFNPLDPLGFFQTKQDSIKNLIIKDYGYMALVELKSTEEKAILKTLESFEEIAKEYPQIRFFSENFMSARNLHLILTEVNYLLGFASLVFISLYFIIIRIPVLTINTICTLICSNAIAILIVSHVYPKVTIMALSFGMGISNIAIDYMMHHNFFSLYAHKKKVFNKPVFYGYITTVVGFGACLFIPFPLLSQLALYAIISLSISYVFFAFVYPKIGFSEPRLFVRMANLRLPSISSYTFLMISLIFFVAAAFNLKLDFDLSKLDYQNKPMLQERDFFHKAQDANNTDILLSSSSIDGLITLSKILQKELDSYYSQSNEQGKVYGFIPLSILPTQIQMKHNLAFLESKEMQQNKTILKSVLSRIQSEMQAHSPSISNTNNMDNLFNLIAKSYAVKEIPIFDKDFLAHLGFSIVADTQRNNIPKEKSLNAQSERQDSITYHYLVSLPKVYLPVIRELLANLKASDSKQENSKNIADSLASQERKSLMTQYVDVEMRSLQSIMDSITEGIYQPMLIVLGIAFCLMTITLIGTARGAFLDSYVFILFPLSSALLVVSLHSSINLMHLFALLILVVVSVDYGIYSVKEGDNPRTAHAIFFSSITTGISFGILITSQTKALNSFGEIIFVGMSCVLLMLVFHKPLHRQVNF